MCWHPSPSPGPQSQTPRGAGWVWHTIEAGWGWAKNNRMHRLLRGLPGTQALGSELSKIRLSSGGLCATFQAGCKSTSFRNTAGQSKHIENWPPGRILCPAPFSGILAHCAPWWALSKLKPEWKSLGLALLRKEGVLCWMWVHPGFMCQSSFAHTLYLTQRGPSVIPPWMNEWTTPRIN